ncbi:MAG TPA: glucosidase [Bryobacteraceae bacterium]|jgi:hypothetical protein
MANSERGRLEEVKARSKHWRRWGPYLSERAWGTVREDYSATGAAWEYFPHDHARSRVFRWSEDGIAGLCDNHQRLCFSVALWNGRDPILKERLFGLTGNEGNHGEDVKEYYYYLDSTPTHSYMKALYKYPQAEYPYDHLVKENHRRTKQDPEYELIDTGVLNENRYFDVFIEYAKNDEDDILIRLTVHNRGPETARLHLLPTFWFRNTWSWNPGSAKPEMHAIASNRIEINHQGLGMRFATMHGTPQLLFTDNESNTERLWNYKSNDGYYKDAFHEYLIHGKTSAVRPEASGTKACGLYTVDIAPGMPFEIRLRLSADDSNVDFNSVFLTRIAEADEFYSFAPPRLSADGRLVQRQAFAGMLWSKQFYNYAVDEWLDGDPGMPKPPEERKHGRNSGWVHLFNEDVVSMPDNWEYPWYAAWDLSFHMIPFSLIDPEFAKDQLHLFLREWYMHPNGQLPAYEWAFDDVNPPVHAWACWRVFTIDKKIQGKPDYEFLERAFHKLLLNFTWWVNRKDQAGNNIFEGGFLGLDNVGVFDRSKPLPTGGYIEQSDGTSWMAMYSLNMLKIAMELSTIEPAYEDIASKFFEHFLYIASAINKIGGDGLWDEQDQFYYDVLRMPGGENYPLRVRSVVGLIPLFAVEVLEVEKVEKLPGFKKRMEWFMQNRPGLTSNVSSGMTREGVEQRRMLSIVGRTRIGPILERMLDETEFLSPHGIRSISKFHEAHPFVLPVNAETYRVDYEPAESRTGMFGGNSNWRGPVWFPINYLLIESIQKFHYYFGDEIKVECPKGSGNMMNLWDVSVELSRRLSRLFLQKDGRRPVYGGTELFQKDPHFANYINFYEYFHGDNGAGLGASHQTGWTGLVAKLLQQSGE